jgi:hypothetical protein
MTPLNKPVVRKTRDTLGWGFGCDTGRCLVIKIESSREGDTLTIRPHGTRRAETVRIEDIYHWAIRSRVLAKRAEKAREAKAAKKLREEARELKRRFRTRQTA